MSECLPGTENRWLRAVPWTACLVALGLWLRCYHYLRDPSMWHDEAALVINVLNKSWAGLFGPLFFAEAAPPLFLVVEKAVTWVLDDSTFALRLVPFLASCAALVLLVPVARRLLDARAAPWAILLFACSDQLLWHACEAKPYAVEVLGAVTLLAVYAFTNTWPLPRRLFLFSLLAPPLIWLAYPGCFLCGGLLVALLPEVWRARRRADWLAYGALTLAVFGAFTALALGPVHAQRCAEMTHLWDDEFPPWDRPLKVPLWAISSTFEVGRYCCRPTGQVLTAVALVGAWVLWRRGRQPLVALLALPVGLALVASLLGAYPYGGSRVLVYAAPAVVLLVGAGVPWVLDRLRQAWRFAPLALLGLLLAPVALCGYRLVQPWDRADCYGASAYVLAHRLPADAVAVNHWEYLYYFRGLGPALTPIADLPRRPHDRVWLVLSGATRQHRLALARRIPPGNWRTVEQREFDRTTVLLLRRPSPDTPPPQ
jgi:hypothetical protein